MLKEKKRINNRYLIYLIIAAMVVLAAVISVLTIIPSNKKPSEPIHLQDKCSIMLGSLIHQIKDEASCRITCRNYCETQELDYLKINFTLNEQKCNECWCYCR